MWQVASQFSSGRGLRWFSDSEISRTRGDTFAIWAYTSPGSPVSGPCTVWQNGVATTCPSAHATGPEWSWTTSYLSASSRQVSVWCRSGSDMPIRYDGGSS